MNEFLSWNESDFCGIDMLVVPRNKLWAPDLSIQEEWVPFQTREHAISGEIVRVCLLVRPFKFFPSSDIFKHLAYS